MMCRNGTVSQIKTNRIIIKSDNFSVLCLLLKNKGEKYLAFVSFFLILININRGIIFLRFQRRVAFPFSFLIRRSYFRLEAEPVFPSPIWWALAN